MPFKYLLSLLATLEKGYNGVQQKFWLFLEKLTLCNGINKMSGTESRFSIGHLKLEIFED